MCIAYTNPAWIHSSSEDPWPHEPFHRKNLKSDGNSVGQKLIEHSRIEWSVFVFRVLLATFLSKSKENQESNKPPIHCQPKSIHFIEESTEKSKSNLCQQPSQTVIARRKIQSQNCQKLSQVSGNKIQQLQSTPFQSSSTSKSNFKLINANKSNFITIDFDSQKSISSLHSSKSNLSHQSLMIQSNSLLKRAENSTLYNSNQKFELQILQSNSTHLSSINQPKTLSSNDNKSILCIFQQEYAKSFSNYKSNITIQNLESHQRNPDFTSHESIPNKTYSKNDFW